MIKVSVVLSIHNRSKLFGRALQGYIRQSMPPEEWEVILVDDLSSEQLSFVLEPWIGQVNIRHVRMDHTRHSLFKEMNTNWTEGVPKHWFHTPALSTNLGCALARGEIICLCHPEILHARTNFERAYVRLQREKAYIFGRTFLGTQRHNTWLDEHSWVEVEDWSDLLRRLAAVDRVKWFLPSELYWYTSFLPREAVTSVRGVDFEYLRGVAGEDDDFRERVKRAGWKPVYAEDIMGFHQDHSNEKESHRQRDTQQWQYGLEQNRKTYRSRLQRNAFPAISNENWDWTAKECLVSDTCYWR